MNSPFLQDTSSDRIKIASLLQAGEVVALPTETVYGLAANALDPQAVRQIFEIKGRPLIDPLIVHLGHFKNIHKIAHCDSHLVEPLVKSFWPGPLTIILKKKPIVPDLVTAGRETVAIRMPAHPLTLKVLQDNELFIAAPSANPFGYVSPTRAEHVLSSLGSKMRHIAEGGPCQEGVESTIVDLSKQGAATLLRPGPISKESLEKVLGQEIEQITSSKEKASNQSQIAPGLLSQHYSPRSEVFLLQEGTVPSQEIAQGKKIALLMLSRNSLRTATIAKENCYWLSENGDLKEVARNLFHMLRFLDEKSYEKIIVQIPEMEGLGVAINDRLQRAAAKK